MWRASRWLYGRLGRRYLLACLGLEIVSTFVICLATVGVLSIYEDMTASQFASVVLFGELCVALALIVGTRRVRLNIEALRNWLNGDRSPESSLEAWRVAIGVPVDFVARSIWRATFLVCLPTAIYFTWELQLPAYSAPIIFAGALVALGYSAVLHFFAAEALLRPLVIDIENHLDGRVPEPAVGIPLRWKLLGALPLINVFTGVIVAGLTDRQRSSLEDLGLDVIVAVVVAFTVSLELTILVSRSVLAPVGDLLDATEHVKEGDLSVRVPIVSGDELGELATSFNLMVQGLAERERLREAFGSYVDPDVAQRVAREGLKLEGEEREVTVVWIDIVAFTSFAEHASAQETVSYLNEFFGVVVPLLAKHQGHANKFIGDGVMGLFGALERIEDHADRALASALEIERAVEDRWNGSRRIGIGVNSGPVSAGSIGGGGRLEFTVIGDTVNVAARVEAVTRSTGDTILLTEATRALLSSSERDSLEPRGTMELKGREEPVRLWTPPAMSTVHRPLSTRVGSNE